MMTKALVVDDERKMRRILQMLLERMGIESVAAESAEEALERFGAEKIDLVLTDLRMPGKSGIDLLAEVRTQDAEVPVIVFTATAPCRRRSRRCGAGRSTTCSSPST